MVQTKARLKTKICPPSRIEQYPRANSASLRPGHVKRDGESTTERRCRGDPWCRQSWPAPRVALSRRVPGASMGEPLPIGEEASVVGRLAGNELGVLDSLAGNAWGGVLDELDSQGGLVRGELLGWVRRWESVVLQLTATSIDASLSNCSWSARRFCEGGGA